jgi:hypothetical protein
MSISLARLQNCHMIASQDSNSIVMNATSVHTMPVLCNRIANETTISKASVPLVMWSHHKDDCDRIGTSVIPVLCKDCNRIASCDNNDRIAMNTMQVLCKWIRNETTVCNLASVLLATRPNFDRIMTIMMWPEDPDTPCNQDESTISGVTCMTPCPDPPEQGDTVDNGGILPSCLSPPHTGFSDDVYFSVMINSCPPFMPRYCRVCAKILPES